MTPPDPHNAIRLPPPLAGGGKLLARSESNLGEGAFACAVPLPQVPRADALELAPSRKGRGNLCAMAERR